MGVPISSLPAASALTGAELFPVVQSGQTKRTTTDAIPYVPAGTGAVTTTVQSKLRETVSVFDFMTEAQIDDVKSGAATLDVQPAIAAAVASFASTGGEVMLLPGVYAIKTDAAISVPANVAIIGFGMKTILRKTTGAADIFTTTANKTAFKNFRMEGPSNTSCDGIIVDAGATGCIIENIEGYQLSSTITCGPTARVYDIEIDSVVSRNNMQQGIHTRIASRVSVTRCKSFDIGTSALHHGMYIGECIDLTVNDFYAEGCQGFGLQAYTQGASGVQKNLKLKNITVRNNGKDTAAGTRGGLFVGSDGTAQSSSVIVEGVYAEGNGLHNVGIDGYWDNIKLTGLNLISDSGTATTANGLFVGSGGSGDRSLMLRDFTISGHSSNGIRIAISTATVKNFDIDQGQLLSNISGIYATGTSVVGTITLGDNIQFVSSPLNGTFAGRRNGTNLNTVVQSITATYTFDKNGPNVLLLNPSGGSQYVYANPGSAPLPAGWIAFVKHTGASNVLYFDPYGINVALNPGQYATFVWTGSAWTRIG